MARRAGRGRRASRRDAQRRFGRERIGLEVGHEHTAFARAAHFTPGTNRRTFRGEVVGARKGGEP